MALILNEEQQMLREAAAGFLRDKAPVSQLRELRDSGDPLGYRPEVWQEMVNMGWTGIAIPEAYGGVGYGYTGLGIVLQEVGRHLSASPLGSSVLTAATVILQAASEQQKVELLPRICSGEWLLSLALEESGHHQGCKVNTSAKTSDGAIIINGCKRFVDEAASANAFIVAARDDSGLGLFVVAADLPGVSVQPVSMVDSRNSATVSFQNVAVTAEQRLGAGADSTAALQASIDISNVGISAELLGLSQQAFELTLAYLKEREQFAQAIGSFQGLQHRAAELFCELELGKSMVLNALQAIDDDRPECALLASATKAKLCEIARLASNEAVQMHGGIGMTDEYDIGFYLKRARALEHRFGDRNYHLDRYATLSGY